MLALCVRNVARQPLKVLVTGNKVLRQSNRHKPHGHRLATVSQLDIDFTESEEYLVKNDLKQNNYEVLETETDNSEQVMSALKFPLLTWQ